MATRTFHPLPKRPNFASVPSSVSTSQRHSHQQNNTHSIAQPNQPQNSPSRVQSTSETSPATPIASSSTPQAPPLPSTPVQQQFIKNIPLPPTLTENTSILGSRIKLDSSFHISCATYSGSTLDSERFREHIISTWKSNSNILEQNLYDFGQEEGQITIFRYEDILCDTEEYVHFGMQLLSSSVHPISGPLNSEIRSRFLHALRERLIHLMCRLSDEQPNKSDPRLVQNSPSSFILVPRLSYKIDEWSSGWSNSLRRPLLKVTLSLHLNRHSSTTVDVLCHPTLSNLHVPSHIFPLEPNQRLKLLPHNVSASFVSHLSPNEIVTDMYSALRQEFSNCLEPGWSTDNEFSGLVKVWIPVVPKDQPSSVDKSLFGVEYVYPISHILVETTAPVVTNVIETALHRTSLRLEERVKEIGAFIDGVVKERERARIGMHANAGKLLGDKDVTNDGENIRKVESSAERPRPHKRQRTLTKDELQQVRISSPGANTTALAKGIDERQKDPRARPKEMYLASLENKAPALPTSHSPKDTRPIPDDPSNFQMPTPNHTPLISHEVAATWNDLDMNLNKDSRARQPSADSKSVGEIEPMISTPQSELPSSLAHKRRVSDAEGDSFDFTDDDFRFFDSPGQANFPDIQVPELLRINSISGVDPSECSPVKNGIFNHNEDDIGEELHSSSDVQGEDDSVQTPLEIASGDSNSNPQIVGGSGVFEPIDFGEKWNLGPIILAIEEVLPSNCEVDRGSLFSRRQVSWKELYEQKTDPKRAILKSLERKKAHIPANTKTNLRGKSESSGVSLPSRGLCSGSGEIWSCPVEDDSRMSDEDSEFYLTDDEPELRIQLDQISAPSSRDSEKPLSSTLFDPDFILSRFSYSSLFRAAQTRSDILSSQSPRALLHNEASPVTHPISAPTPVSPGANSVDRIKSFESVANALAQEVFGSIELFSSPQSMKELGGITVEELGYIDRILFATQIGKMDIKSILNSELTSEQSVESYRVLDNLLTVMQAPHLLIGLSQAKDLLEILPPAIHFWDKLGLRPKNGHKNIQIFLIESRDQNSDADDSQAWLKRFHRVYQDRLFGEAVVGDAPGVVGGVLYSSLEFFRRSISSLIDSIPPQEPRSTVIFVSIPSTAISLDSPTFRQILLYFHKLRSTRPSILFHLISNHLTLHVLKYPKSRHMGIDQVACRVYDRLLCSVKRPMRSRFALLPGFGKPEEYFQAPSYTLVGPDPSFQMSSSSKFTLDVTERHMLFHFAYRLSSCERWLAVTCVDQSGCASNVKVWALGDNREGSEYNRATDIVQRIWSFIIDCARMADIEWRIIITKVGDMEEAELQAWDNHVSNFFVEETFKTQPVGDMHVSILFVLPEFPWIFVPSTFERPNSDEKAILTDSTKDTIYTDISSFTYAIEILPGLHSDSFANLSDSNASSLTENLSPFLRITSPPILTTALVRLPHDYYESPTKSSTLLVNLLRPIPSPNSCMNKPLDVHMREIVRNFYELQILAECRWGQFGNRIGLPLHILALQVLMDRLPTFSDQNISS